MAWAVSLLMAGLMAKLMAKLMAGLTALAGMWLLALLSVFKWA